MNSGITQLVEEIEGILGRYRQEADISYAEVLGSLELIKADIIEEAREESTDEVL